MMYWSSYFGTPKFWSTHACWCITFRNWATERCCLFREHVWKHTMVWYELMLYSIKPILKVWLRLLIDCYVCMFENPTIRSKRRYRKSRRLWHAVVGNVRVGLYTCVTWHAEYLLGVPRSDGFQEIGMHENIHQIFKLYSYSVRCCVACFPLMLWCRCRLYWRRFGLHSR